MEKEPDSSGQESVPIVTRLKSIIKPKDPEMQGLIEQIPPGQVEDRWALCAWCLFLMLGGCVAVSFCAGLLFIVSTRNSPPSHSTHVFTPEMQWPDILFCPWDTNTTMLGGVALNPNAQVEEANLSIPYEVAQRSDLFRSQSWAKNMSCVRFKMAGHVAKWDATQNPTWDSMHDVSFSILLDGYEPKRNIYIEVYTFPQGDTVSYGEKDTGLKVLPSQWNDTFGTTLEMGLKRHSHVDYDPWCHHSPCTVPWWTHVLKGHWRNFYRADGHHLRVRFGNNTPSSGAGDKTLCHGLPLMCFGRQSNFSSLPRERLYFANVRMMLYDSATHRLTYESLFSRICSLTGIIGGSYTVIGVIWLLFFKKVDPARLRDEDRLTVRCQQLPTLLRTRISEQSNPRVSERPNPSQE